MLLSLGSAIDAKRRESSPTEAQSNFPCKEKCCSRTDLPSPPENQDDDTTLQCGSGGVSLMRRNRSVSIKDQLQQLSIQEEVVLVNSSIQQHVMDLQLQEAKRRTEEQSLVLDMRTQQLLNYTHEHVSQTRSESERRMNEQMIEGIQAPHSRFNNELQVLTRNLQQDIQAHIRVEREQQLAEVENRLALQASEIQDTVSATKTRVRADLQSQLNELESKLEHTKSWMQVYLRTAMESHNREVETKVPDAMRAYLEQQFQQRDADMAKIISAQIRAERRKGQRKQDERIQACVDNAARAVEIRVDAKLVELKNDQEQRCRDLQFGMEKRLQHVQSQASPAPQ